MIPYILRLEGACVFLLALLAHFSMDLSWLLFLTTILLLDISMIGYFKNAKVGATIYNLVHNYVLAIILIIIGAALLDTSILSIGLGIAAHVGIDRALGFGLKHPKGFKETHLGRIGK